MKRFLKITTFLCIIIFILSNGVFAVESNDISDEEIFDKLNEYAEDIETFDDFFVEDTEFIVQKKDSDELEKVTFNELHEENKLKYNKVVTETSYYKPNVKEYVRDDFFNTQLLSEEDPPTNLFIRMPKKEYRLCRITINGGLDSGTGFLVGPKLLLTAAHCIYDKDNNIMPVVFYPAYDNGSSYNEKSSGWQQIYTYPTWRDDHNNRAYDLALIELDWNMGDDFGWFGSQSYGTNQEMNGLPIKEYGYPKLIGDAKLQYYTEGSIQNTHDTYFHTTAVNYRGMSGGPIVRTSDNYAVGLVSGLIRNKNIFGNVTSFETYGRRITQDIIDLINSYN